MIEIQHLHKRFGDVTAVSGLSFTAPDAAITGLLGANGAGKTTTLGMVTGLLAPDSGTVSIGGGRAPSTPRSLPSAGIRRSGSTASTGRGDVHRPLRMRAVTRALPAGDTPWCGPSTGIPGEEPGLAGAVCRAPAAAGLPVTAPDTRSGDTQPPTVGSERRGW